MLTLARTTPPVRRHGLLCRRLTETRWRVTRPDGAVVGYLVERPDGEWSVERMTRDHRGFVELDRVAGLDAGVDALRRS